MAKQTRVTSNIDVILLKISQKNPYLPIREAQTLLALSEGFIDQDCWRLLFYIIFFVLEVVENPLWLQHLAERKPP